MESMPRPRPPFLHREITRHGVVTWYFRLGKGPRIRIRGEFGSAEFHRLSRGLDRRVDAP
jgi:hypothetical protein